MSLLDLLHLDVWAATIEFIGALLIGGYAVAALVTFARTRDVDQMRLTLADGVIVGLDFKLAGTLLKTVLIHTWDQLLFFAAILVLRIALKQVFTWEADRIRARQRQAPLATDQAAEPQ
jgi:uncharacterized membrane protein